MFTIFLLIALLHPLYCYKLLQVQVLNRHCDRVSTKPYESVWGKIPKDPVNLPVLLNTTYGALTQLGQRQCFVLGQKLRETYHGKVDGLDFDAGYDGRTMEFAASHTPRTLRTMWSVALGLMPKGRVVDVNAPGGIHAGEPALPNQSESIPIKMIPWKNDIVLNAFGHCPKADERYARFLTSSEYKNLQTKYASQIADVETWTGWTGLNLENFYLASDMITVQAAHNQVHIPQLLENLDIIQHIGDVASYIGHSRSILNKGGAGPLIKTILDYQQTAINQYNLEGEKSQYIRWREWSAHDTTIMSTFATLMMDVDHEELRVLPGYGSALAFELWLDEAKNQTFSRVRYLNGYASEFQSYTLPSLGCVDEYCPFDLWKKGANEKCIPSNWCNECGNSNVDICVDQKLQSVQGLNTAFFIVVPLLSLVVAVLFVVSAFLGLALRSKKQSARPYEKLQGSSEV